MTQATAGPNVYEQRPDRADGRRCDERGDQGSDGERAEEEQSRCPQLADCKECSRNPPVRPSGDSRSHAACPAAAGVRPFWDTSVGPTIVYERSPTDSSAEPTPSTASHD